MSMVGSSPGVEVYWQLVSNTVSMARCFTELTCIMTRRVATVCFVTFIVVHVHTRTCKSWRAPAVFVNALDKNVPLKRARTYSAYRLCQIEIVPLRHYLMKIAWKWHFVLLMITYVLKPNSCTWPVITRDLKAWPNAPQQWPSILSGAQAIAWSLRRLYK